MAAGSGRARTPEDVRRDIGQERERLAEAVEALREDLGEATDVAGKLRAKLPLVAAGALGLGFVAAGGIGATMRLLMRRGREGETKARFGRFSLVDRD
jgi:hypothetical protein